MAYRGLGEFIAALERAGELKRIRTPLSWDLEIAEVTDRVSKRGGPALLFEHVVGYDVPVLTNAFGSPRRMALALGVDDVEEIAQRLAGVIRKGPPDGLLDRMRTLAEVFRLGAYMPKVVRTGRCKEVILRDDEVDLLSMPVLKCWPGDGGRFITLPMVFAKSPRTGVQNAGMYRLHVYDSRTTGMHWHVHKTGAEIFRYFQQRGEPMEVAVALGGDPAVTYAATAPLPDGFDEMIFAGFLRQRAVEMVRCETVDLLVPADAEYVLEGTVDPNESRLEGPFGDHTGYYSQPADYPVFRVRCITRAERPIYPATVVGRPPMEDCYLAKATERIFLPLIQTVLPEVVDINLPIEGVFHNLAFVSIRKSYPGQARKVMHALWGMGQMMFTKIIVVFDEEVNVHDLSEVLWRLGSNVDPRRDTVFVDGPVDILDHAAPAVGYGSKMGIDATRKLPEEGYTRPWPEEIAMSPEVKRKIDELWGRLGL